MIFPSLFISSLFIQHAHLTSYSPNLHFYTSFHFYFSLPFFLYVFLLPPLCPPGFPVCLAVLRLPGLKNWPSYFQACGFLRTEICKRSFFPLSFYFRRMYVCPAFVCSAWFAFYFKFPLECCVMERWFILSHVMLVV